MITLQNVKKDYPGFTLDLTSLNLPENRITGLVGTNGSGKTTTFKLILGLIKPDGGKISVMNESAWMMPVSVKEKIGVVFPDSGFLACLCPKDIRAILKAFYPDFDPDCFDALCRKMDLPMNKPIEQFSTGMTVRMKLIAAISHNPQVLILDEPTAGLDILARNSILELLQDYMEKPGRSVLISSHIASDLEKICDDFYLIDEGKIILQETVDAIQNEYGVLIVSEDQFKNLDQDTVLAWKKGANGYRVLVSDRQFYQENNPGLVMEKGGIDDLIVILEEGERK